MYASFSWRRGDRLPIAHLISPPMWNVGCVQFYYYRTFLSSGRLDVLTQIGKQKTLVWTVDSSDVSDWMFASIPITSKNGQAVKVNKHPRGGGWGNCLENVWDWRPEIPPQNRLQTGKNNL